MWKHEVTRRGSHSVPQAAQRMLGAVARGLKAEEVWGGSSLSDAGSSNKAGSWVMSLNAILDAPER